MQLGDCHRERWSDWDREHAKYGWWIKSEEKNECQRTRNRETETQRNAEKQRKCDDDTWTYCEKNAV